jgi:hypothetical protein
MTSEQPSGFEDAPGTLERRLGPRRRVFLAGRALIEGRVVEVTFRDISERGARLLVAPPNVLRGLVPVLLLREGLVFRGRVIWNQSPMFGVAFDETIDLRTTRPASYEPLAATWDAWRTAPQTADD